MGTCTFFICLSHCTGCGVPFALCIPFFFLWYGSYHLRLFNPIRIYLQFHLNFGLSTLLISSFMSFVVLFYSCPHSSHTQFSTHPFICSSFPYTLSSVSLPMIIDLFTYLYVLLCSFLNGMFSENNIAHTWISQHMM